MYKAVVLLIAASTLAVTEARYNSKVNDKIYSRFTSAFVSSQKLKEKYELTNNHDLRLQGSKNVGAWSGALDVFDCARGFARGLQFSNTDQGACVVAIDSSINAADDFTSLLMMSYLPWVWGDILMQFQNYTDYIANIQASCDIQKLINTFTVDSTTFFSSMVARVGGGFIAEIPKLYGRMKGAQGCYDFSKSGGKLFAMLFDYQI